MSDTPRFDLPATREQEVAIDRDERPAQASAPRPRAHAPGQDARERQPRTGRNSAANGSANRHVAPATAHRDSQPGARPASEGGAILQRLRSELAERSQPKQDRAAAAGNDRPRIRYERVSETSDRPRTRTADQREARGNVRSEQRSGRPAARLVTSTRERRTAASDRPPDVRPLPGDKGKPPNLRPLPGDKARDRGQVERTRETKRPRGERKRPESDRSRAAPDSERAGERANPRPPSDPQQAAPAKPAAGQFAKAVKSAPVSNAARAQQAPQSQPSLHGLQNLQELLSRIRSEARVIKTDGALALKMNLKPASLGRLILHVEQVEGRYTLRLLAESAEAARRLEQHLPAIRDQLAAQGIQIDRSEVEVGSGREQHAQADARGRCVCSSPDLCSAARSRWDRPSHARSVNSAITPSCSTAPCSAPGGICLTRSRAGRRTARPCSAS